MICVSVRRMVFVALVLGLAGCDKAQPPPPPPPPPSPAVQVAPPASANQKIANSHHFAFELPNEVLAETQRKHLEACRAAGCAVISTQLSQSSDSYGGRGHATGSISARIAPDRFAAFAAVLTAPPAALITHTEKSEDETLAVLDVEKRLEAQLALRDRLTALLKQPGISVADLMAIEKNLAEVQGTIEIAIARRDSLRTYTNTVLIDVDYNGVLPPEPEPSVFRPVTAAVDEFGRTIVTSLAQVISFVAIALPWLPLVAILLWLVRWVWGGRRRKTPGVAATDAAPPPARTG